MTEELIIEVLKEAFYTTFIILLPILGVSLVVGILISIFQAATSISEQTLTFVPKLVVVFLVSVLMLPFMISNMKKFTIELFNMIPTLH